MMNTIINFGDYLEGPVLEAAEENATEADLVLCLGTTLRVTVSKVDNSVHHVTTTALNK
jgi:NAD-dependent SIR2 family protein deacetylase